MNPDAPASPLAVAEIEKGLQHRQRRQMRVTFSGPGALEGMTIDAEPEVGWLMIARSMTQAIERQLAGKEPRRG